MECPPSRRLHFALPSRSAALSLRRRMHLPGTYTTARIGLPPFTGGMSIGPRRLALTEATPKGPLRERAVSTTRSGRQARRERATDREPDCCRVEDMPCFLPSARSRLTSWLLRPRIIHLTPENVDRRGWGINPSVSRSGTNRHFGCDKGPRATRRPKIKIG